MGTLAIGVRGGTKLCEVQKEQSRSQICGYIRKLNEVDEDHLGFLGKSVGSMNLEEFIKNAWTHEIIDATGVEGGEKGPSIKSLQRPGSLPLSRTTSEKIVDEVWRDIQQGEKIRSTRGVKREPSMGEMTLEDFLEKTGAVDEPSLGPVMPFEIASTSQCFSQHMVLSPAPSIGTLSDTPILTRKRDTSDTADRGIEKRLKRKIKNRESAARSRARKQAYHNELVNKVSRLEEQNLRLKREKELENRFSGEVSGEPRYQLRRTSSAIF